MIKRGGAALIVSLNWWRLVTREGIRVRIKRIKKGGGVETRKGSAVGINEDYEGGGIL